MSALLNNRQNLKSKPGRKLADCWGYFCHAKGEELAELKQQNRAVCKNCNNEVTFGQCASRVQVS